MCGRCVGDAWEMCGRCVEDAWEMCGRCVEDTWEMCGMYGAKHGRWFRRSLNHICTGWKNLIHVTPRAPRRQPSIVAGLLQAAGLCANCVLPCASVCLRTLPGIYKTYCRHWCQRNQACWPWCSRKAWQRRLCNSRLQAARSHPARKAHAHCPAWWQLRATPTGAMRRGCIAGGQSTSPRSPPTSCPQPCIVACPCTPAGAYSRRGSPLCARAQLG